MSTALANHIEVWERIKNQILKNRFPQALLFSGPRHAQLLSFAKELISKMICEKELEACGHCRACHLLAEEIYPDVSYVHQESAGSVIKIEQIRDLQMNVYQTPQLGHRRFIVIDPADRMNLSAVNALLKILEEPPSHTFFILIAERLHSIPATILSRCQKYSFNAHARDVGVDGYLALGRLYPPTAKRFELYQQHSIFISTLCKLIESEISPCTLATEWADYDLQDLLWFLYLIIAEVLSFKLTRKPINEDLLPFAQLVTPIQLFTQLDRIHAILKKLNHNLNINQTLVLEDFLLSFLKD